MKRVGLAIISAAAAIGLGLYVGCSKGPATCSTGTTVQETGPQSSAESVEPRTIQTASPSMPEPAASVAAEQPAADAIPSRVFVSVPAPTPVLSSTKLVFDQALETVLSRQASYEQKQAAWKQLKKTGKLESAIADLEQRVAANPQSAEAIAGLGQAYYKKAGDTEDIRESAILAMKADQTLEAALNLDPSNWDARFMRAVGMTYWPLELNRTKETIEQFQILIQQQETQAPQPQFARTYLKLGEYYEKAGYPKYAATVWERGAALFPADTDLEKKLAAAK